jgi:predicted Fe-Mo cluster-binding NifX family protein
MSGRAPYYLIFDEKGVLKKSLKNPAINSRRDASSEVIGLLLKESCEIVIAGQFGNKMQNLLKQNNIRFYIREGTADKVIQSFIQNKK